MAQPNSAQQQQGGGEYGAATPQATTPARLKTETPICISKVRETPIRFFFNNKKARWPHEGR